MGIPAAWRDNSAADKLWVGIGAITSGNLHCRAGGFGVPFSCENLRFLNQAVQIRKTGRAFCIAIAVRLHASGTTGPPDRQHSSPFHTGLLCRVDRQGRQSDFPQRF
jgi:hypothetical protein